MEQQGKEETPKQVENQVNTDNQTGGQRTDTVKTYTQDEVAKMQSTFEKKAREAEEKASRAEAQLNDYSMQMEQYQDQLSALKMQMEEKDFAGLDDTDEGQRIKQLYRKISTERESMEKQQRELRKREADAMQGLKTMDAIKIGNELGFAEFGLSFESLLDCKTRHEMAIKAAKMVAEKYKTPKTETKPEEPEQRVPSHVDSVVQNAGGPTMAWRASDIQKMSDKERIARAKEIKQAVKEGRVNFDQ